MSGTGDRCHFVALGGLAEVLEMVQTERPMLAVGEYKIEVELAQNVDRPRRWEERA
jgi:hypothetical protein